jgi:DNA primase
VSEHFDVREYIESNVDRATDSAGDEITAVCPNCDVWGGFYINGETGKYVCFKCDFRGKTIVGLVAHMEGLSYTEASKFIFQQSVKLRRRGDMLTLRERISLLRGDLDEDEDTTVEYELPQGFKPCFDKQTGKWSLPEYLRERKIKSATAQRWGLGWCRSGRYAARLIIPIVCPGGFSFTARDMTGDGIPKYLNPTGADHRMLLIGWDVADLKGDFDLVEGPADAIMLDQHGIPSLAVGGKVLHDDQLAMLFKLSPHAGVTIMLDPEEKTAPYAMANQLAVHFEHIYIAHLPLTRTTKSGKVVKVDPGNSTRKEAKRAQLRAERFTGSRLPALKGSMERMKEAMGKRYDS